MDAYFNLADCCYQMLSKVTSTEKSIFIEFHKPRWFRLWFQSQNLDYYIQVIFLCHDNRLPSPKAKLQYMDTFSIRRSLFYTRKTSWSRFFLTERRSVFHTEERSVFPHRRTVSFPHRRTVSFPSQKNGQFSTQKNGQFSLTEERSVFPSQKNGQFSMGSRSYRIQPQWQEKIQRD